MYKLFLILMFILLFCNWMSLLFLILKRNNRDTIIKTDSYVSQNIIFSDLDNIISYYIENFIFENKMNDGEIYYNDERLNSDAIKLSSEIIVDLSDEFIKKINMYITTRALQLYITKKVIKLLLNYANNINSQK